MMEPELRISNDEETCDEDIEDVDRHPYHYYSFVQRYPSRSLLIERKLHLMEDIPDDYRITIQP